ncbi:unnamed protein product [Arabis nemorensis]|uniref:Uncharacterized protein n=1 Tax=Arabis nemorensis TaxID=586526 RepID=A0A565CB52_9BRAS|nr:unnamed protein product [Arabis nemorensis]
MKLGLTAKDLCLMREALYLNEQFSSRSQREVKSISAMPNQPQAAEPPDPPDPRDRVSHPSCKGALAWLSQAFHVREGHGEPSPFPSRQGSNLGNRIGFLEMTGVPALPAMAGVSGSPSMCSTGYGTATAPSIQIWYVKGLSLACSLRSDSRKPSPDPPSIPTGSPLVKHQIHLPLPWFKLTRAISGNFCQPEPWSYPMLPQYSEMYQSWARPMSSFKSGLC